MYIDRIDLVLPQTDITSVLANLASASGTLEPLPSVSTADRKRYAKLGLKNEALALQIIEVGRANPDLIPRGIDFEKIDRDCVAREQLRTLKIMLEAILGRVNDSMLLTGVDIYAAALSIYHCLRRNADTTSLKDTVDELKRGFARPSRKKKQPEPQAAPTQTPPTCMPVEKPPQPEPIDAGVAPVTMELRAPRSVSIAPAHPAALSPVLIDPRRLGSHPACHISLDHPLPIFFSGGFTSARYLVPEVVHSFPNGFPDETR